jgi:hypothetical protein
MSIRPPFIALAALAAALLPSCEMVRSSERWESISGDQSSTFMSGMMSRANSYSDLRKFEKSSEDVKAMSKRKRRKYEKELASMRNESSHSMDRQRIDTTNLFGGTRDNKQFGNTGFGAKKFTGNKVFAGNEEYQRDGFQFAKDREMARKEALAASQKFSDRDKTAGTKRWFGRDKSADTGRAVDRTLLTEADDAQRAPRQQQLDSANVKGADTADYLDNQLSLHQLRDMLGREGSSIRKE